MANEEDKKNSALGGSQWPAKNDKDIDNKHQRAIVVFFQRYFYYAITAEALALALIIYFLLVKPEADVFLQNQRQNIANEAKIEQAIRAYNLEIRRMEKIAGSYNAVSASNAEAIHKLLPSAREVEDFLTQINSIIKDNGIFLQSLEINEDDSGGSLQKTSRALNSASSAPEDAQNGGLRQKELKEVNLFVSISGVSYRSLKNLLAALENNLRLIDVNEIKYDPLSGVADISITTYFFSKQDN